MKHLYRLLSALSLLFVASSAFSQTADLNLYNVGANVNSALRELAPIISPDGRTLYVMVYGHEENQGTDDIW